MLFIALPLSLVAQSDPVISLFWDLYNNHKELEAFELIDKAITENPEIHNYYLLRATANVYRREPDQVLNDVNSYLNALPPNTDAYLLKGDALLMKQLSNEAILAFNQAHSYANGLAEGQYCNLKMAEAHNQQGNYNLALEKLEKAKGVFSFDSEFLYIQGMAYLSLNQLDQAEGIKEKLIEMYPNSIKTYSFLTVYYQRKENYPEALKYCKKKIEIGPYSQADIDQLRKLAVINKDTATTITAIEQQLKYNPGELDNLIELSQLYFVTGNYSKALAYANLAISVESNSAQSYKVKGDVYKATNLDVKACDCYFIALKKGYNSEDGSELLQSYLNNCEKK